VDNAQEIERVAVIADDQPPEVAQPRAEALDTRDRRLWTPMAAARRGPGS
jgi:hypothetical protein